MAIDLGVEEGGLPTHTATQALPDRILLHHVMCLHLQPLCNVGGRWKGLPFLPCEVQVPPVVQGFHGRIQLSLTQLDRVLGQEKGRGAL
jgi:hypothetical protein